VQFDPNDLLYVYLDRRRRRRKFLLTTLLRAFGNGSDHGILSLFYKIENKKISSFKADVDLARSAIAVFGHNEVNKQGLPPYSVKWSTLQLTRA
jgi:DNA-directed RNA polymerase beta subunit